MALTGTVATVTAGSLVTIANMGMKREHYPSYTDAQFAAYNQQSEEIDAARKEVKPYVDKANALIEAARAEVAEIADRLGIQVEIGGLTYHPIKEKEWIMFDKEGNPVPDEYAPTDEDRWYKGGWYSSYETY